MYYRLVPWACAESKVVASLYLRFIIQSAWSLTSQWHTSFSSFWPPSCGVCVTGLAPWTRLDLDNENRQWQQIILTHSQDEEFRSPSLVLPIFHFAHGVSSPVLTNDRLWLLLMLWICRDERLFVGSRGGLEVEFIGWVQNDSSLEEVLFRGYLRVRFSLLHTVCILYRWIS